MRFLLLLLLLLPSCSIYRDLQGLADQVKEIKAAVQQEVTKADLDQSGSIDSTEEWIALIGGVITLLGGGYAVTKGTALARDRADHKTRTALLEAKLLDK